MPATDRPITLAAEPVTLQAGYVDPHGNAHALATLRYDPSRERVGFCLADGFGRELLDVHTAGAEQGAIHVDSEGAVAQVALLLGLDHAARGELAERLGTDRLEIDDLFANQAAVCELSAFSVARGASVSSYMNQWTRVAHAQVLSGAEQAADLLALAGVGPRGAPVLRSDGPDSEGRTQLRAAELTVARTAQERRALAARYATLRAMAAAGGEDLHAHLLHDHATGSSVLVSDRRAARVFAAERTHGGYAVRRRQLAAGAMDLSAEQALGRGATRRGPQVAWAVATERDHPSGAREQEQAVLAMIAAPVLGDFRAETAYPRFQIQPDMLTDGSVSCRIVPAHGIMPPALSGDDLTHIKGTPFEGIVPSTATINDLAMTSEPLRNSVRKEPEAALKAYMASRQFADGYVEAMREMESLGVIEPGVAAAIERDRDRPALPRIAPMALPATGPGQAVTGSNPQAASAFVERIGERLGRDRDPSGDREVGVGYG